jgi:hypothetical protein
MTFLSSSWQMKSRSSGDTCAHSVCIDTGVLTATQTRCIITLNTRTCQQVDLCFSEVFAVRQIWLHTVSRPCLAA